MPSIKNIVEPIMFLYMFAEFMNVTTFQSLLFNRICLQTFNKTTCSSLGNGSFKAEENFVQKQTSNWILYSNVILLIPSTFVSFLFGPFSDSISRKIVIILPIVGNALLFGVCMLVSYFENAPLGYILIGYFISGLFGGYIGLLMGILSYATHVTDIKYRTIRIGIIESMIFFAGTIGVFLSGILLKYIGYTWMYGLMFLCSIISLIYCIFIIEDITNKEDSMGKNLLIIFKTKHFKDLLAFITKPRNPNERVVLSMTIIIIGIMMFLIMGQSNINQLYLRHSPISSTVIEVGYFTALQSFLRGISLLVLLPLLKKYLKPNDFLLCLFGLISRMAASVMLGLSRTKTMVFIVPFLGFCMGFSAVALRGVCSCFVLNEDQGKLFTIISSLENVMSLLAAISFNELYSATVSIFPGLSYLVSAGISGLLVLATLFLWKKYTQIDFYTLIQESKSSENI